jgi:hypothetical protein
MPLTDEAKLLSGAALDDFLDDFIEETIDVISIIPEILATLVDGLSPDWDVPGVFDDTMAIPPGGTNPLRTFHDYPLYVAGEYDYRAYFTNNQQSIDGDVIGRNTFLFILAIIGVFLFAKTGARKASVIFAVIMNKFFGVKARINQLDDKVDTLLQYAENAPTLDNQEISSDLGEIIRNQFEVIKTMLGNADEELTGFISAVANDRSSELVSKDWDDGVIDVLADPVDSPDL